MDNRKVESLIKYILAEAAQDEDWRFRELGPVHLIKYVYLADMYFAAKHDGETYTGIIWEFYHLGPWSAAFFNEIPNATKAIGADLRIFESQYSKDGMRWSLKGDHLADGYYDLAASEIPFSVMIKLKADIRNFGQATNDLLHYVYVTQPMVHATPGELLDFRHAILPKVQNVEDSGAKSLPKKTANAKKKQKQKQVEFRERLAARKKTMEKIMVTPKPNYDEVFFQGTAALNELTSGPISEQEGVMEFDDSIWKTSWRQSVDLS
jgi:hypothetical protein